MPLDPSARVWPFGFSRLSPVVVERSYLTSMVLSEAGREQRRAERDRPRKTLRFGIIAADYCYRRFNRELHRTPASLFALPDWTRKTLTTTVFTGGTSAVDAAAVEGWAAVGETVILAHAGRFERYTIAAVGTLTLTFVETNPGADWPVGTRIYAALPARLRAEVEATRPIRDVMSLEVTLDVVPTEEFYIAPPVAPVTFNGREVFPQPPHRIAPIDHTFITGIEEVDVGFGATARFQPVSYPAQRYQLTYTGCDAAKTAELEDVFGRARGRQGEFYMPTWEHDLKPTATASAGTTSLVVEGDDAASAYGGSSVFRAVAVHFHDNSFEFNTVSNVTPGSGVSTLTLGSTWSRDIDPLLIRRISWMPVCRFASDQLVTEWPIDGVGRLRMSIQTLEDL